MATSDAPSGESKSSSELTKDIDLESESRLLHDNGNRFSSPDGALKTVDVQQENLISSLSASKGDAAVTAPLLPQESRASIPAPKEKSVAPAPTEPPGKPINTTQSKVKRESSKSSKRSSLLEKISGDLLEAKVFAWQEAMTNEINTRYKHEEARIQAWEDHQKAKASLVLKKEEMRQERRRIKFLAKMETEIARSHRKAQELKQSAYAKKELEVAQVNAEAEHLKETGKILNGCFSG